MNKKILHPTSFLLAVFTAVCVLITSSCVPVSGRGNDEREVVKVGYFHFDGYHEQKENGHKSGYGYELLQYIQAYSNMDFEYIGYDNSWEDMQKMLLDGEIDMVTSASKSEEREELFEFSDHSIGETETLLTTRADNTKYVVGDYKTYNGMVVGAITGSTRNDRLEEFAEEHNYSFTFKYYNSQQEMNQALKAGDIDCIISSNYRYLDDEIVLNVIDVTPTYVMAKKGNTELLEKVDAALSRLDSHNPGWKHTLFSKYYNQSSSRDFAFTQAEQEFINLLKTENQKLKVLYNPARDPYCFTQNGQAKGALTELFMQALNTSGIPYELIHVSDPSEYLEDVQQGKADLVIDSTLDLCLTEQYGYYPTVPITTTTYARIELKDRDGEIKTAARIKGSTDAEDLTLQLHPNVQLLYYPTFADCVEAVVNEEADCVYTYSTKAVNYPALDKRLTVETRPDSTAEFRALVNRSQDPSLYGIVNKLVNSMDDNTINDLVSQYASQVTWTPSFWENLRQTPAVMMTLVVVALILLGLAVSGFVMYLKNEKKHRHAQEEFIQDKLRILREKQDSEEVLTLINDILNSGLWYFDYDEDGNMTKVYWSDIFRHLIGFENEKDFPNEFDSWRSRLHPDDYEQTIEQFRAGLSGKIYDVKYRLKVKNGGYEWFNAKGKVLCYEDGKPRRFMGTFFNITMAENEARDVNSRLSTVIGGIHGGLKIASQDEGFPITFISQEAAALQGYSTEEFMELTRGLTLNNIHEDDRTRVDTVVRTQFAEGRSHSVEYRVRHKDGRILWIHDFGRKTIMPDGSERIYSLIQDITREKEASKALEEASAAKTNFLSAMSHDIRTPMNAISGLVDIALRYPDDPKRMIDSLHKIREAGNHLLSLVNDVLDIASIESGKLVLRTQEHNIAASFDHYYSLFKTQLERKDQEGVFDLHDIENPWVVADDVRLKQIFTNLLSNAIKYTPEGGQIRFEVCQKRDDKNVLQTVVIVEDNGIGMNPEFMDKMWDSFTRATDTRINKIQGAGLGLSIVRQLVELMNGTVEVESEINKGTRFIVSLPLEPARHKNIEEAEELDSREPLNLKVLIAEDNDLNWEIAQELLEMAGVQTERAENGQEALNMFVRQPAGTYDAILMDMQMPVMNGLEATRAIRSSGHPEAETIPIIAMTANAFAEDVAKCREAGMNDHLSKPIDMKKVVKVLRRFTRKS
ncbi:MAG: transporter substrate-binding domain-containing protein [Erysipelotrichaceae bacterium]|nr:transporter substrate-binding domain-containing protein [Erysipelotrichaceae bacterium]